jgi:hypothetical protein
VRHVHRCHCGAELRCAAAPDQCAVCEPWSCPACLQQQRDDYFQQYAETRRQLRAVKADLTSTPTRRHTQEMK